MHRFRQRGAAKFISDLCLSLTLFCIILVTSPSAAQDTRTKEPPKCLVQGQVIHDPSGQPLKKATIELRPEDKENGTSYKAISDAEGKFKFEKVDPGDYTLKLERNGFLESGKGNGSHKFTLHPGQEIKDMVLRMRPMAVISGRVLDSDGDPLPGAYVTVSRYGGTSRQRADVGGGSTDDLGEYRAGGLRPGRYLIEAVLNSYSPEPGAKMADGSKETAPYPTYYPGVTDKSQAVPVEVRAGDQVPINITLAYGPAYRVRGSIVGLPELRGSDTNMFLRPKDPTLGESSQFETTLKSDGSFEIPNLLPGEYRVIFFKMDGSDFHAYQAAQIIVVTDTDLDDVRLSSESDTDIRGQFRTENGEKPSWTLMSVTLDSGEKDPVYDLSWPGPSTRGQFKSDGSFEIKKVPPGKYLVTLNSESTASAFYIKSVSLGGKDVTNSGFSVSGGSWSLDAVLSSDGGTLEGVVLNEKDQPVPDAQVIALPDTENRKRRDLFKKVSSDQHGHFIISGVRPGEYSLLALDELEDDYRDPDVLKPFEDRAQTVRLQKDQRTSLVLKVIQTSD